MRHLRIVPDDHRSKQGTRNLAHPTKASEYHEGGSHQSDDAHTRHVALADIAKEIAYHVASYASEHIPKEINPGGGDFFAEIQYVKFGTQKRKKCANDGLLWVLDKNIDFEPMVLARRRRA